MKTTRLMNVDFLMVKDLGMEKGRSDITLYKIEPHLGKTTTVQIVALEKICIRFVLFWQTYVLFQLYCSKNSIAL